MSPGAIFELKVHQNVFATHWGAYSAPQTPSWFSGTASGRRWEGKEMEG